MIKKLLFIISVLLFALRSSLFANPIDSALAKKVAINFLTSSCQLPATGYKLSATCYRNSALIYILNLVPKGFVIVSADDDVKPVLAYSTESNFGTGMLTPALSEMMDYYNQQIQYVRQNSIKADKNIKEQWKLYSQLSTINYQLSTKKGKGSVSPLLTTRWDQAPYYNSLCPADKSGRAVTGCVATAMAQIMRYWNHPAKGTGHYAYFHPEFGQLSADFANTTFDWANMSIVLGSSSPQNQVNAVATLMYNCGVSINMDYNAIGSGVPSIYCVKYALENYFYYSPSSQVISKYNYTDAEWISLLENELLNNRPVQYAGFGNSGGHSWVCDGFDSNDYIHFNWGWSGTANGYFSVDNLDPTSFGTTYIFNYNQKAVIGIQPVNPHDTRLALNSVISVNPDTIIYSKPFTVKANLKNTDTVAFNGRFAAFLYDKNNNYYLIDSTAAYQLPVGCSQQFTFNSNGIALATPGVYKLGILYRSSTGNWLAADSMNYKNYIKVIISNTKCKLKLHSELTTSTNLIIQNTQFDFTTNIDNCSSAFKGDIAVVLYSEAGDSLLTLASACNMKIDSAKYDTISFKSLQINSVHGRYLLGILFKENNHWSSVSPGNYSNPVQIIINSMTLKADKYEPDNSQSYAYKLPLNFTGDSAHVNTDGSNIHISGDVDFYKLVLDKGYDYDISARMFDINMPYNGEQFTTIAIFGWRYNDFWSDPYYDYQTMSTEIKDGGTLYFVVRNYYMSEFGTYLLDINVKRHGDAGIQSLKSNVQSLKLYPNPATNILNIEFPTSSFMLPSSIIIYDNTGRLHSTFSIQNSTLRKIDLSGFTDGIYYLEAIIDNKVYTQKFVVSK